MDKTYDPRRIESRWYKFWEDAGYFAPGRPEGEPYCIMIPPPNVTGTLHMGHAFQDLIMDALIRYHRMRGRNTLWQPGTDHAGIATQLVVERLLATEGKNRRELGREKFVKRIWQWKNESGDAIASQLRRLGASPDWANARFTMDAGLSAAVNEVFVRLYDEGLIYRGKRLVNWDPVLRTAVSDLEVASEVENGTMYYVRYPFVDNGDAGITIGTTRPETILVDGAIAVHPADDRHRALIGRRVWVPLTEPPRAIEIIADEHVDPEFGSGCVKITAAHDFNDYEVYLRHPDKNIPLLTVLTPDAKMNDNAPKKYVGLDRYDARKKIVEDLASVNLLIKQTPHQYKLPRGDRSGAVVEPMLTDQWFVDLTRETLACGRPGGKAKITRPAIEMVARGRVQFVPDNWRKTYYQWLENVEDWCISRQIWWGHRIPAWYDAVGNVYVGHDEAAVRKKHALADDVRLRQDEDVLDTWFSSALWPFSTLGWPEKTVRLRQFYPTTVLVTGFDIIFFWVARMIMMGAKFMGDAPFHRVYIHGLVRDAHGQKMSKSKGNVLDPIDLIDGVGLEELVQKRTRGLLRPADAADIERQTRRDFPDGIPSFGADALRFTFAALASTGRDINFDLARTVGYRNFCNKIWNAARFVRLHTEGKNCAGDANFSLAERWIISQLQHSIAAIHTAVGAYRFDLVAREIHEFVWQHYCDWFVELCKPVLANGGAAAVRARYVLLDILETILRLSHPIMPFITEEIWQTIAPLIKRGSDTIMTQPYPRADADKMDARAMAEMQWVRDVVLTIRQLRGENHIAPARRIPLQLTATEPHTSNREALDYIQTMAKTEPIQLLGARQPSADAAVAMVGTTQIIVPLAGLMDKDNARARVIKSLQQLEKIIARGETKLNNAEFVNKAPAAVVQKEKVQLQKNRAQQVALRAQLQKLR